MTSSIKQALAVIGNWSLPIKFLGSALIAALAGSSVLGALFEYATHTYALAYGFRPPVEGIPHLRAFVAATSLLLLASGAALAAVVIWLFSRRREAAQSTAGSSIHTAFALLGISSVGVIVGIAIPPVEWVPSRIASLYFGLLGTLFGAGLLALTVARPRMVWWIALGFVTIYYAAVLWTLFTPAAHARLLRHLGFGGGLPLSVQLDEGGTSAVLQTTGHLMLRTASVHVVYSPGERRFFEYELARVVHSSYEAGTIGADQYTLPDR